MLNSTASALLYTCEDFWLFLKNPVDRQAPVQTAKQTISVLLRILLIEGSLVAILGAIIYCIEKLGLVDTGAHRLDKLFQQLPLWQFALLGIIINPFIEELLFRNCLRLRRDSLTRYPLIPESLPGWRTLQRFELYLIDFWAHNFPLIFYGSALAFAYFHLTNYESSASVLMLSPVLLAPQFLTGLFLGYLRIRYSFILGYSLHAIHNAFFIGAALVLY